MGISANHFDPGSGKIGGRGLANDTEFKLMGSQKQAVSC